MLSNKKVKVFPSGSENHIYLQRSVANEYEVFYNIKPANSNSNTLTSNTQSQCLQK